MPKIQKEDIWVPRTLTDHNVGQQLGICKKLLQTFERKNFLRKMVTGDEVDAFWQFCIQAKVGRSKLSSLIYSKNGYSWKGNSPVCMVGHPWNSVLRTFQILISYRQTLYSNGWIYVKLYCAFSCERYKAWHSSFVLQKCIYWKYLHVVTYKAC